jgi:hypothetical protein
MSGTKRVIRPFQAVVNGDMSADIRGKETNTEHMDYASYIINWTGTSPVGVMKFEAMTYDGAGVEVWTELELGSTITISGDLGSHQVLFNQIHFAKLRPFYDRTSGVGTLNITAIVKEY